MSEHEHHQHPDYRKIYYALVALLVVSVLGPFLGVIWLTLITAFGVALVKATLVIQNFMHLKWEKRIMQWMLATTVLLMALLVAGVAPDIMRHQGQLWVNEAAVAAVARGIPDEPREEREEAEEPGEEPEAESPAGGGAGGAEGGAGAALAGGAPEEETQTAEAFDAQATFQTTCSGCHGMGGAGDGPVAATLSPKPANFTDPAFWETRTEADVARVIREGGASVGRSPIMAPFGALFDEAQAAAIAAYLKTLAEGG